MTCAACDDDEDLLVESLYIEIADLDAKLEAIEKIPSDIFGDWYPEDMEYGDLERFFERVRAILIEPPNAGTNAVIA